MNSFFHKIPGAILLPLFLFSPVSLLASRSINLVDVPSEIMTAIEKKFKGAKMLDAEVDKKKNKTLFEVEICHHQDLYEVTATRSGKIVSTDLAGSCT